MNADRKNSAKAAIISRAIVTEMENGASLREAFDKVIGPGEVYDALKVKA